MRRTLLVVLILLAARTASAQNFFFERWEPKTFEGIASFDEDLPRPGAATVTVTLSPKDTVARVSPFVFGNNAVGWQGPSHTNARRMRHYRNALIPILRFPGGSWSDQYFWNAPMSADIPKDIGPMFPDGRKDPLSSDDRWKLTPAAFYTLIDQLDAFEQDGGMRYMRALAVAP